MIPRFSLTRPATLLDAFAAHADHDGDAAYLAGGTELLQVMKMGFAQFGTLIDLKGIDDLRGIDIAPDGRLRIGAATTHRAIERSPIVRQHLPSLAALAARVANVRVRNTGTLGGNLAFAEPHSDPATFLLACGATVELAGPNGRRELAIGEFVLGPLSTAREPDEVIVAIHVPPADPATGRAYDKIAFFERPAASVAVSLSVMDGRIRRAIVAVGSLTEAPTLVPGAGAALEGVDTSGDGLGVAHRSAVEAFSGLDIAADLNGSPEYKRHLAGVLLGRAVRGAVREASAHA
ncbi:MAG TPA: FAD binding domain-containing protein [Candidatus Limnocylindrales bacterium]|nr:FAD binding domain-containing protein [Candidatus Limnocylindrales bacterium]